MRPFSRACELLAAGRRGAPAGLAVLLAAAALAFLGRHAVDWFYNDDIATLRWFAQADAGRLTPAGLLDLWNNEHPVGAQFALLWALRGLFGLDMRAFVLVSAAVVAGTAALAARLAAGGRDPLAARLAAVWACFALAFQPTQMEHLLWSFELGWFVVNAVAVADAALVERLGPRGAAPAFLLCGAASLCSAQGAFTFFAASAHQALMPARRGRAAATIALALGGAAAVAHLLWRVHPSASAPERPDRDVAGILVYAAQVVGGLSGARDPAALLAVGLGLIAAACTLLMLRRRSVRPDRWRVALVLMGFTALCVAAFARGRHHLGIGWATSSFHAAPLLVPALLGLVVLLGAPAVPRAARRPDSLAAAAAVVLLAATTAAAWPYGVARARLWAMDQGYARWAACAGRLPAEVAARASGVDYDTAEFMRLQPLARPMCDGAPGPLEGALILRPPLFDALAARRPDADAALDALWQDYATNLNLQVAFKPWRADAPGRLLAFAGSAPPGDLGRLAPFAAAFRALAAPEAPPVDAARLVPPAPGD